MIIREPAYFQRFRCIADRCPDSCCKEWDVEVDPDTAAFYRSLTGDLGDRLRQVIHDDPEYGPTMTITDGRCPMWRADGLCRIQAELGEEALCKTCREFPRLTHDYGDFVEKGLELSCPEAARLILTTPVAPILQRQLPGGEDPDYDREDMQLLLNSRQQALELLTDERYSVTDALALTLMYGYHIQAQLDGEEGTPFDPEAALEEIREFAGEGDTDGLLQYYSGLEILTDDWKNRLAKPAAGEWFDGYRALACYGVNRYWLQAISDFDLVCRVKMILWGCVLVRQLGGDFISTAQLYSKEIENNADNVDAILDGTYTHPALTDAALLGHLLSLS